MERTELFLALIVFLLAAQVYERGDGHTPEFIVIPVLMILFLFPVYVVGTVVIENVLALLKSSEVDSFSLSVAQYS